MDACTHWRRHRKGAIGDSCPQPSPKWILILTQNRRELFRLQEVRRRYQLMINYSRVCKIPLRCKFCPSVGRQNSELSRRVCLNTHAYFISTLEGRSVERIPPPPTLTFDLNLPKFNHLVPCGQGYDWPSLVTIGLELAPESCSQTYLIPKPTKT